MSAFSAIGGHLGGNPRHTEQGKTGGAMVRHDHVLSVGIDGGLDFEAAPPRASSFVTEGIRQHDAIQSLRSLFR